MKGRIQHVRQLRLAATDPRAIPCILQASGAFKIKMEKTATDQAPNEQLPKLLEHYLRLTALPDPNRKTEARAPKPTKTKYIDDFYQFLE